jgi:hypothetical protein
LGISDVKFVNIDPFLSNEPTPTRHLTTTMRERFADARAQVCQRLTVRRGFNKGRIDSAMAPKVAPKAKAAPAPKAKAVAKAKAKAKAMPRMRARNGHAVLRNLQSVNRMPAWLRNFEIRRRHNLLDTGSTQTIAFRTARPIAEWLLHQPSDEQGRWMHALAVFRNRSCRRILREYHTIRQRSQVNVHRSLDGTDGRIRAMVVAPSGMIMG